MSDKVQLIKQEIERLDEEYRTLRVEGTTQQAKEADLVVHVLLQISNFIDSLPEQPAREDLEEYAKKLVIIMDSKEGDTNHICNQKSCPFYSKTEDGDMGILCKKLWATPPKGESSLASLCNYYDVQNLVIAEAEENETINQILKR